MGKIKDFVFRGRDKPVTVSTYKMITAQGEGYLSWDGKLYKSDIVRAAIRPKARAMGKAVGKHIRETLDQDGSRTIAVNPEVYMRFLLEEPNAWMTGQVLQEAMAVQLALNGNAFALIVRDGAGYPTAIYPIDAAMCEALQDGAGELYIRFSLPDGKTGTYNYRDLIHLRRDYQGKGIFGESQAKALTALMEVVNITDQGIVKAIKNSNAIR